MNQQFENSVRDMLERRSLDISEAALVNPDRLPPNQRVSTDTPDVRVGNLASGQARRPELFWARGAALILIASAVVGVGVWSTQGDSTASEVQLVGTTTSMVDAVGETTATTRADTVPAAPNVNLAGLTSLLPSSVDLLEGPPVLGGPPNMDAPSLALAYLEQRLPGLSASIKQIDLVDTLTLFRWQAAGVPEATGYIVVRIRPSDAGVVASFTDQIDGSHIERTVDGLQGTITSTGADEFAVEIVPFQDARYSPLASVTVASLAGPGSSDLVRSVGGRVELDRLESPRPLNIRIVELEDTPLAITEMVVGVVGFSEPCGVEPPITIEIGDLLQPLQTMPEQLPNQLRWLFQGEDASLEIRWPADPTLTTRFRLPLDDSAPVSIINQKTTAQGADSQIIVNEVVLVLANEPANPCSMVQINVSGSERLSDAWSSALTYQWQFEFGLNVAEVEVDPGPSSGEVDELIVGSTSQGPRPTVPFGACDGLPNDPPRQGVGNNTSHPTPEQALANFIENQPELDPPLPTTGYYQVEIDDLNSAYVYNPDQPVVVISIASGEGWSVVSWEASPC